MKTKFYTLFIGLLMAACITSYGQEITIEFSPTTTSYYSDIVETSSGTLLIGSSPNPYTHQYIVYKATTDGIFLDSLVFSSEYQLLEIPSIADTFLLVGFSRNYPDNIYNLKLTLIDSELNTLNEAIFPIGEQTYHFWDGNVFISPAQEIVFPYSVGIGDVLHIMRIGLDLTLIEDKALPDIPRGTWDDESTCDSVLFYTRIGVFSNSPLIYHCLGFYKDANDTTVFINYILDNNFNYAVSNNVIPYDENMVFTGDALTTLNEVENENNHCNYHLMATSFGSPNDTSASIVKFNDKNAAIAMYKFTGSYHSLGIGQMVVKDYNAIYFTHSCIDYYRPIRVARLNGDLDLTWEMSIGCRPGTIGILNVLKVLHNGDILVGAIQYYPNVYPTLHIYIINESLNNTNEAATTEMPYTLYPNPVKDRLTLRFDDGVEPESVELYDLAGRLVGTKPNGLESMDISAMPSGVYLLRITTKDGTRYHEKIVKE